MTPLAERGPPAGHLAGLLCCRSRGEACRVVMLYAGLGLYALNLAVGLAAQLGLRLGVWHHVLYAVVFAGAALAAILHWHPALLLTLVALAGMPKTRPGGPWHPALALAGLGGYVGALIL